MQRTIVTFVNKAGLRIKGIVFEPSGGRGLKTGVMYLPGIVLGLTAVHRLSFDIAGEFQQMGHPVFLFDHSGIGESEGELFSGSHEEFANFIKQGGLVADTLEAMDDFISRCGLESIILIGHCGGALTALYAAVKIKKVSRLILISPPLIGEVSGNMGMTQGQTQEYLALYNHKIFSPRAWSRIFSGKSDYRQIFKTIAAKIFRCKPGAASGHKNLNRAFLDGLQCVGCRTDVKIIYGDRDPGFEEFMGCQEEFARWNVRTIVLPDSSHGFVTDESLRLLMGELKLS